MRWRSIIFTCHQWLKTIDVLQNLFKTDSLGGKVVECTLIIFKRTILRERVLFHQSSLSSSSLSSSSPYWLLETSHLSILLPDLAVSRVLLPFSGICWRPDSKGHWPACSFVSCLDASLSLFFFVWHAYLFLLCPKQDCRRPLRACCNCNRKLFSQYIITCLQCHCHYLNFIQ